MRRSRAADALNSVVLSLRECKCEAAAPAAHCPAAVFSGGVSGSSMLTVSRP